MNSITSIAGKRQSGKTTKLIEAYHAQKGGSTDHVLFVVCDYGLHHNEESTLFQKTDSELTRMRDPDDSAVDNIALVTDIEYLLKLLKSHAEEHSFTAFIDQPELLYYESTVDINARLEEFVDSYPNSITNHTVDIVYTRSKIYKGNK